MFVLIENILRNKWFPFIVENILTTLHRSVYAVAYPVLRMIHYNNKRLLPNPDIPDIVPEVAV